MEYLPYSLFAEQDIKVWDLSKWRFLQCEASLWIISNKLLEVTHIIGFMTWIYFEFISVGSLESIKYLGLLVGILSFLAIRSRRKLYIGYFNGYEQGFRDAATRNCDYWSDVHALSGSEDIDETLEEIKENEKRITDENINSRAEDVKKGFSKLVGFIVTWPNTRLK